MFVIQNTNTIKIIRLISHNSKNSTRVRDLEQYVIFLYEKLRCKVVITARSENVIDSLN